MEGYLPVLGTLVTHVAVKLPQVDQEFDCAPDSQRYSIRMNIHYFSIYNLTNNREFNI